MWQGIPGECLTEVMHHLAVYPSAQGAWGDRGRLQRDPKSVSERPSEGASGGEAEPGGNVFLLTFEA